MSTFYLKICLAIGISTSIFMMTGCGETSNINGTVAMGAPMQSGQVEVYDSAGKLAGTVTTDAQGQYSLGSINQLVFPPPYTVKAVGVVGDSTVTLMSVATQPGTTNVNQISNAIASTLTSDGDPTSLIKGGPVSTAKLAAAEQAFQQALKPVLDAQSVSGSLISGSFTSAMDGALDAISALVKPDGQIVLATSAGQQLSDIVGEKTSATPGTFTATQLARGSLPSSTDAIKLQAATSDMRLTAKDLEPLRAQLEACFAGTVGSGIGTMRAADKSTSTADWAINKSECNNLATANFKHAGTYWLDTKSGCSVTGLNDGNTYCQGLWGAMLRSNTYNNMKFGVPTHIRPAGANTWHVKFPVKYNDGSYGQLGDIINSGYMIVTKVKDSSLNDVYRFAGDQRDVGTRVEPVTQKIVNLVTGAVRYEIALNFYVNAYSLRALTTFTPTTKVWVKKAKITGKGLPPDGIYLANKVSGATFPTGTYSGVGSSQATNYVYNVCGGYLTLEFPDVIPADGDYTTATPNAAACAGIIRLAFADLPSGAYSPPATPSVPSFLAFWPGSQYLSDSDIASISAGEPYTFELTLSNGATKTYVNRISHPLITPTQAQALRYPSFKPETISAFTAFGSSDSIPSSFTSYWDKLDSSQIWSTAMYWSKGASATSVNRLPPGSTSYSIACPTSASPQCTSTGSWKTPGSTTPNSGILQLRSRTFDGLQIFSQIRQY